MKKIKTIKILIEALFNTVLVFVSSCAQKGEQYSAIGKPGKTNYKIFLLLISLIISFAAYTQNHTIDSLQKVLQVQKEDTVKVDILNELVSKFRYSNTDTALYFANAALALANRLNYEMGIADSKLSIGMLYANMAKYDEGLVASTDALILYNKLISSATVANKDKILAKVGHSYNVIAHNTSSKGNYPEGLKNSFLALKIREKIGDKKGLSDTEYNLGCIYFTQHNYSEALKHYNASLKISEQLGIKLDISITNNTIGHVYFKQGDYPEALKKYLFALKLANETNDKNALGEIYINLGVINDKLENYSKALQYDLAALKLYEETGVNESLSWIYNMIGVVYMKQKKYRYATEYMNKALSYSKKVGSLEYTNLSYENFAALDSARGNYKIALEHFKFAVIYRDSLFGQENTKKMVRQQMQYDFDRKEDSLKEAQEEKDIIAAAEIKNQKLIRNFSFTGTFAILCFGGYSFYRFRKKKKLQSQQTLMNERLRISRELHDEVGATLSSISIFSQAAIQKNESGNMADTKNILERIGESSREVMSELNDTVWLINPGNDNLQKIIQRISNYALPLCRANDIHFEIKVAASAENLDLSMEKRKAIYLIIKEAVNNSLKYATAKNLVIQFEKAHHALHISIKDDGSGLADTNSYAGNGFNNMKQRAMDMNGKIDFHSVQQNGTTIILQVPLTNIGD